MKCRFLFCLLMTLSSLSAVEAAPAEDPAEWFTPEYADADLLILGTFHFKDAGLDNYKPEVDVDVMSEARQAELATLLNLLAAYQPTKILIEVDLDRDGEFNKRYSAYLEDEYELGPNEIYQVGFRLAKRMGHTRVYAIDADGRDYPDLPDDLEAYAKSHGQANLMQSPWGDRYTALYRAEDQAKASQTLVETLVYMNDPDRLRLGHGHYVLRSIGVGQGDEYPGADQLTGWWYNRNLRIFANIVRVTEPGDRLLLVIGAGHVPILKQAADSSPEYRLVEVRSVLEPD